ncbi:MULTISPECIES: response regulator [Pseudoalteromonas]|uniref:Response regulator n=1 Tax=Pseudoalteromonas obscura TaxID=3048491 RepID=A0ABT7EKC6_9GAMM|nr:MULTISPECIES: response regulator [Pseudoalteromonas]MBQ4837273.1 response regulator [Pseudoalteromonas luteoviolacea]MDK2595504.1 response regulator [Pseudoalteromonas sp. P94(2023)]
MTDIAKVLIVDDEEAVRDMITAALKPFFVCEQAESASDAFAILEHFDPQVVLMDISMPGIDGLAACEKIKTEIAPANCAVFLVSGYNNLDMRLRAFDVGADDFIAKPFQMKELVTKVQRVCEFINSQTLLKASEQESITLALSSMQQASHYSLVMQFFKLLNQCSDQQQVINQFFSTMKQLGMLTSIMIKQEQMHFYGPGGTQISPIEQNIFELLCTKGRLHNFGRRLIVNEKHISFLIKNMPESPEENGAIQDISVAIIEGVEAKLIDLGRQHAVEKIVLDITNGISELHTISEEYKSLILDVTNDLNQQISSSFHILDLTEEQELFIANLIAKEAKKLSAIEPKMDLLKSNLTDIIEQTDKYFAMEKKSVPEADTNMDINTTKPELF